MSRRRRKRQLRDDYFDRNLLYVALNSEIWERKGVGYLPGTLDDRSRQIDQITRHFLDQLPADIHMTEEQCHAWVAEVLPAAAKMLGVSMEVDWCYDGDHRQKD